jgi:ribosomal protein S18 acetylase RimI-like enzyme
MRFRAFLISQKSGFRPEVVLELEQVAVLPKHHGQGVGRELIEESLPFVRDHLAKQGSTLKHIIVTTRADNHAQKLYRSTLGAEVEATIVNLYSADEVFMVARDV